MADDDSGSGDALSDVIHMKLALTHGHVLNVGEEIHEKQLAWIENEKRRAVKATEEVVKREEGAKHREILESERQKFAEEKQQLLVECQLKKEKAISNALEDLREELKLVEEQNVAVAREEEKARFEVVLEEAKRLWKNEEELAVQLAKEEERETARLVAEEQTTVVELLRKEDSLKAENEKLQALKELKDNLMSLHSEEVSRVIAEERQKASLELREQQSQHEEEVTKLNGTIWLGEKESKELRAALEEEVQAKQKLQEDYDNLKKEFADFVNLVPGFRDEFVIK